MRRLRLDDPLPAGFRVETEEINVSLRANRASAKRRRGRKARFGRAWRVLHLDRVRCGHTQPSDSPGDRAGRADLHRLCRRIVRFRFDQLGSRADDQFELAPGAVPLGVDGQEHFARGFGFDLDPVLGREVVADQLDFGLRVGRHAERETAGDPGQITDRQPIEMVGRRAEQQFADPEIETAAGRERVGKKRVGVAVESVAAVEHCTARVGERQDQVGFRAQLPGGGIEYERLPGVRVEIDALRVAAGFMSGPYIRRQGRQPQRFVLLRHRDLRQVVHVHFDFAALATRACCPQFVAAARQSIRRGDLDPNPAVRSPGRAFRRAVMFGS